MIAEESARRLTVFDPTLPCPEGEVCEFPVVASFDLPARPHNITAIGSVAYATHPSDGAVSRLDVVTGELATVPVGTEPHDVKYDPQTNLVYVADEAGSQLLALDPDSLETVEVIALPGQPHDLVISGPSIWLTLLNRSELALVAESQVTLFETNRSPHDLVVDNTGRIWFSNWGSPTLSIFEPESNTTENAPAGVSEPHHFALDRNGSVWVSDNGGSSVVGFLEGDVVQVEVGPVPHHLVFVGDSLVVAVSGRGEAVVVRGAQVVGRIPLSTGLHGAAMVTTSDPLDQG